jgi:hypothetical protein
MNICTSMNDPVVAELASFVRKGQGLQRLAPVLTRILGTLGTSHDLPQAWEALPGDFFGSPLPGGIASCWAFALRAGATFTNERHPNSWQRSIGIRGSALFEIYEDGGWQPRPVSASASQGGVAVSIPPNVWHRIKIGAETFVSVSFHTAPASQLIEETCIGDDFANTKRRLYHG